jgi:hypothetical protein
MPMLARFLSQRTGVAVGIAAAQVALLLCSLPRIAKAQQDAGTAVPPPQPAAVLVDPLATAQVAFLGSYAGRPTKELLRDRSFRNLMKAVLPKTTYHYGSDMSLASAVDEALDGSKLPVMLRDGRYLTVSGEQGPYLHGRGFLWFDLQEGIALGGFYFTPTNGEPSPTLTIVSKELSGQALAMSQLPAAFVQDLYQWEAVSKVPPVTPRYFIPQSGKKYVLVHDEDYCWHPENTPALDRKSCDAMNADAAEADMNAAYFMKRTSNAANATAWMLGPDQVNWLQMRGRICMGPAGFGCRIRMTRQRTWVLIGGPPMPREHPLHASR